MTRDGGLRQLFQKHLPEFFWQSIESWSTGQGVPDLHYSISIADHNWYNRSGWIECKQTEANAVAISPEQVAWAERYWRHSGRSWLAVRQQCYAGQRRKAQDNLWLIHGDGARWAKTGGLSAVPRIYLKGQWSGGPGRWDWAAVKAILTS